MLVPGQRGRAFRVGVALRFGGTAGRPRLPPGFGVNSGWRFPDPDLRYGASAAPAVLEQARKPRKPRRRA